MSLKMKEMAYRDKRVSEKSSQSFLINFPASKCTINFVNVLCSSFREVDLDFREAQGVASLDNIF